MYLLDTNTVGYLLKDAGNTAQRLRAVSPNQVAVSAVTLFELRVGVIKAGASEDRLRRVQQFLELIRLVDFGEREAVAAAAVRADLEKAGSLIGPLDNLLAGTALANSATLVTHNLKEFSRVKGLRTEDWY